MARDTTITVTCNARPDRDGYLWLMIEDTTGDHYAPHLAQYFERALGLTTKIDSQIFLGIQAPPERLTGIIREISRYFTGHAMAARFSECRDMFIDGSPACGHEVVGPVLAFRILASDRSGAVPGVA